MPANIGAELQALPLRYMLGAPMTAAIEAQALAAKTTVDFIKNVGLEEDPADPTGETMRVTTANFTFTQPIQDPSNPGSFIDKETTLSVPLLTLVPIPYIRIQDLNVSFEFKIRDVQTSSTKKEVTGKTGITVDTAVKRKIGGGIVSFLGGPSLEAETKTHLDFSVSATYQSSERQTTDRSATFRMTMNAVQDAIPEGLARTLAILNDAIKASAKPLP